MGKDHFYNSSIVLADMELSGRVPLRVFHFAAVIAVFFIVLAIGVGSSWAGAPFRTDNPETVEYKHGEFYLATVYAKDKDMTFGTAPHFEIDYGVVPNVMLHVITPFVYSKPEGGSTQRGYGDTEFGVEYRFVNSEGSHFMAATFPVVVLPTGDSDKGLGTGHTLFFIPLWLQKSWGPWTTYGGGGFWRNPGEGNKDFWSYGWAIQSAMFEVVTLGAELYGNTKTVEDGKSRTGFTVGAIVHAADDHHLLFSIGSDIHGDNRISAYAAYRYTFEAHEEKK